MLSTFNVKPLFIVKRTSAMVHQNKTNAIDFYFGYESNKSINYLILLVVVSHSWNQRISSPAFQSQYRRQCSMFHVPCSLRPTACSLFHPFLDPMFPCSQEPLYDHRVYLMLYWFGNNFTNFPSKMMLESHGIHLQKCYCCRVKGVHESSNKRPGLNKRPTPWINAPLNKRPFKNMEKWINAHVKTWKN